MWVNLALGGECSQQYDEYISSVIFPLQKFVESLYNCEMIWMDNPLKLVDLVVIPNLIRLCL